IIKGTITEVGTNKPIKAKVEILDKNEKVVYSVNTSTDGKYEYEIPDEEASTYTVSVEKEEYGFNSKTVSTPAPAKVKELVIVDLRLKKLDVGAKFVLRNIYFDFDKATIKQESHKELNKLVKLL